MKQCIPLPITEENFSQCWNSVDCLRRKSRRMSAIARIGGFWSNLTLLFSIFLSVNGLIYANFYGRYHAFLNTVPQFPEILSFAVSATSRSMDSLSYSIGST